MLVCRVVFVVFFFKQKSAYEMRISDWSSDVCSSDLVYFCARWCSGGSSRPAYCTHDTCSCCFRYCATLMAFSVWRSMRKDRVSMPCKTRKALKGDSATPVLRRGTPRQRPMTAAGPKRSDGRRVGTERVRTCRSRWWPVHTKKKKNTKATT